MEKYPAIHLMTRVTLFSFSVSLSAQAQIIPDNTLPYNTEVTPQGSVIKIDGGTKKGSNLFHSFKEFSVRNGKEAYFHNAVDIDNILSRVTGGRESIIEGGISARGSANVFLINPAGIIFGKNSFLNVPGSFVATTADSLLFPDGIEYSASDPQITPLLTINAPIGLGFRDDPGTITNFSTFDNDTNFEDLVGLRVPEDKTLALIGGDVSIQEGFVSTQGGRIEIGSVAGNNTLSLTPIAKGWDVGYEGVTNFQDISLSKAAFVESKEANTGDVQVQGRNISLTEGSQIAINTFEGKAGNVEIVASDSITLDGNAAEVDLDLGTFKSPSLIFSNVFDDATAEGSKLTINTRHLRITNGGQLTTFTWGTGKGVDIEITASEIELDGAFNNSRDSASGIFTQVIPGEDITGEGGELTINTDELAVSNGAAVSTGTLSSGNAGDLLVNADESVKLMGSIPGTNVPSFLNSFIGDFATATGNAGDLTVNTPRLELRDGAQIGTVARNKGNGGNLTLNISDSILLTGASPLAGLRRPGRSGIFVSAQPSFEAKSGAIIPTTGNGGIVNLTTEELTIEKGASISINTFSEGNGGTGNIKVNKLIVRDGGQIGAGSLLEADNIDTKRGNGGTLNINAAESIEIKGIGDINGEPVNSSLFTLAESNGNAGDITLTTNKLNISNGGDINASAVGEGAARNIQVKAEKINLDRGTITASSNFGNGGNINLERLDNLTLRNNSLISAQAMNDADGGNVKLDAEFIIAFPNQLPGDGSDILANADRGIGGNVDISATSLFNIKKRKAIEGNRTNDIDASSNVRGLDGTVTITTPDVNPVQGVTQLPSNVVEPEQTVVQACQSDRISGKTSSFKIKGQGGLAASPNQLPDSDDTPVSWVAPAPIKDKEAEVEIDAKSAKEVTETVNLDDIIPAQGVIVDQQGKIILVGYVPTANETKRSRQNLFNCLKQRHEIDK